jgi:YD repeat-containing protein
LATRDIFFHLEKFLIAHSKNFDANGNITPTTNPFGSTSTYANFTTFNHPGKLKDPNGNYAVMRYDVRGNLTQEIRLRRSYCQTNNCVTLDPVTYTPAATDMIAWRVMAFDANGSPSTTKRVRDFAAQVASPTATSNTGPILAIGYDTNALFPTSVSRTGRKNAEGTVSTQVATLLYDNLGRIKTGIDGDWHSRQFSYDPLDRVTLATDALGNTRSFQYDSNDNPTGQRLDINGRLIDTRSSSFDQKDRRARSVDAGGNVSAMHCDDPSSASHEPGANFPAPLCLELCAPHCFPLNLSQSMNDAPRSGCRLVCFC